MKRAACRLSTILLAWLLGAQLSATEAPLQSFDAANKLYEQGHFADAAAAYEKIIQTGAVAPTLFFNLGNAFYKSGELGRAIASYREAARQAPRDPELRANLQFVRNQVQGPTLTPDRTQRWLDTLTLNEWATLAAAAFWIWLGLLILGQWRTQWRPVLRNYVLVSGLATGLLGLCLAGAFHIDHSVRAAVVIADKAAVHNGPLDESPDAFTLHDGAEVEIQDAKDDWLQVTAGTGRFGWLRREQVELVSPKS